MGAASTQMIAVAIIALIAAVLTVLFIARNITKPVDEMLDVATRIADGDLAVTITNTSKDEIGQLSAALGSMVSKLRDIINEVQDSSSKVATTAQEMSASSEEVTSASNQIADTVGGISKGAQSQAGKTEEVSRAMNGMTQTVQEVATNAQKAAEGANSANGVAQDVGKSAEDLLQLVIFQLGGRNLVLRSCRCRRLSACLRLRESHSRLNMWKVSSIYEERSL